MTSSTFFMAGYLVCPDDGRMRWKSGRCRCGARLIGPGKQPRSIDPTVRTWTIDIDGNAVLVAVGTPDRPYNLMLPTGPKVGR